MQNNANQCDAMSYQLDMTLEAMERDGKLLSRHIHLAWGSSPACLARMNCPQEPKIKPNQVIGLGSLLSPISHWSGFTHGGNSPELLYFTTSHPMVSSGNHIPHATRWYIMQAWNSGATRCRGHQPNEMKEEANRRNWKFMQVCVPVQCRARPDSSSGKDSFHHASKSHAMIPGVQCLTAQRLGAQGPI